MLPDSKWLPETNERATVSTVARLAILLRLQQVSFYLPLAAWFPHIHLESVHQLRVATRRAQAALRLFARLQPVQQHRRWSRILRRIRRAAGPRRDLDVHLARLHSGVPGISREESQALGDALGRLRHKAHAPLIDASHRAGGSKFHRRLRQLMVRIRWRAHGQEPLWRDAARVMVAESLRSFRRGIFPPFQDHLAATHAADLHRLRVHSKRLRYTLEIAASALGSGFPKSAYGFLCQTQQKLGEINDHSVAIRHLEQWKGDSRFRYLVDTLETARQVETQCLDRKVKQFARWWTRDRIAEWMESWEVFQHESSKRR